MSAEHAADCMAHLPPGPCTCGATEPRAMPDDFWPSDYLAVTAKHRTPEGKIVDLGFAITQYGLDDLTSIERFKSMVKGLRLSVWDCQERQRLGLPLPEGFKK